MSNRATVNQVTVDPTTGLPVATTLPVESNRLNLFHELTFGARNWVAIPRRGLFTDSTLWVLAVATTVRLADSLLIAGAVWYVPFLVASLVLVPLAMVLHQVWQTTPSMRFLVLYRLFLVALGFLLATAGLWF